MVVSKVVTIGFIGSLIMYSNCQAMTEESKNMSIVRNMGERLVGRIKVDGEKKISQAC